MPLKIIWIYIYEYIYTFIYESLVWWPDIFNCLLLHIIACIFFLMLRFIAEDKKSLLNQNIPPSAIFLTLSSNFYCFKDYILLNMIRAWIHTQSLKSLGKAETKIWVHSYYNDDLCVIMFHLTEILSKIAFLTIITLCIITKYYA